jgi:hypothetical protein
MELILIILLTGDSFAGKDYCADAWVSVLITCTSNINCDFTRSTTRSSTRNSLTARAVSISDVTMCDYAAATGVDSNRLLGIAPTRSNTGKR